MPGVVEVAETQSTAVIALALAGVVLVLVLISVGLGLGGRAIMRSKGRSGALGFFMGFFLGVAGLLIAALLPATPENEAQRTLRQMQLMGITPSSEALTAANGSTRTKPNRALVWVGITAGTLVFLGLVASVATYSYIHFIKDDAPKRLSLSDIAVTTPSIAGASATVPTSAVAAGSTTATTTVTGGSNAAPSADGPTTYTLTSASEAGYRVVEVLFGQNTEGVGRTNSVTGTITLDGTNVTAATFTVDMTTLKSDQTNRDNKFKGEIMNTSKFPTATFTITKPIALGSIPDDGTEIKATATGDLTLHGVTKSVTLDVTAKKTGNSIAIAGSTDVTFADYSIDNPSNGAVTTQDHGLIEFLLVANS